MPNAVNLFRFILYAAQTWSIGAEEQFYVFWPHLLKRIKNKWMMMCGVIIVYLLINFSLLLLVPVVHITGILLNIWNSVPFDCMAIGGLCALLIRDNSDLLFVLSQ